MRLSWTKKNYIFYEIVSKYWLPLFYVAYLVIYLSNQLRDKMMFVTENLCLTLSTDFSRNMNAIGLQN